MNDKFKIIFSSFILLLIDIIIKLVISKNLIFNQSINVINNFFNITYVKNTGGAWSILSGKLDIIIIITIIVICMFIIYVFKRNNYTLLEIISYSLLLSGSFGNLIDRIVYGYVIDYLDFNIFGYNYPIFNFADICIVIGIILMFIFGGKNGIDSRS